MVMLKDLEGGAKAVGLFHITGAVEDPQGFALGKQKQLEKNGPCSSSRRTWAIRSPISIGANP